MAPGTVWTSQEDEELRHLVEEHGEKKWTQIANMMSTRKSSKQCRRRWLNHLNMDTKKCGWAPEEDELLLNYHKRMGNKWTEIAKMIGGRTDNAVKNRYHALARKDGRSSVDSEDVGNEQVAKPPHTEDPRSLEMWRSSLEKLRSWINRKKRRYLDDAVASAIRAVDENSCGVDDMETDPSPYLGASAAANLQTKAWPTVSNPVDCNLDLQSCSESQQSQERNNVCQVGQMSLVVTSMDDSSSLEVVNEMMEIESEYNTDNKMENSYRAPYSENSSKSSSSEKFGHPESMGVQNGYGHQAVHCEPKWWVMQEEYPHSTLCSPVMHSGSIDEYYPEVSMGIHSGSTWHEMDVNDSYSNCTPLDDMAVNTIMLPSSYIQSEQSQTSCL